MSHTIAEHAYMPSEHAPDPVVSYGDPTKPGKVGIWLFLASEIMFFVAMLGTYIVLRSGSPKLFSEQARALSKTLGGINTLVLIFSSLTMALAVDAAQKRKRGRVIVCLLATLLCATVFMGIKGKEYLSKFQHHTVVASVTNNELAGPQMGIPNDGRSNDLHIGTPPPLEPDQMRIPYDGRAGGVYGIIHRVADGKDTVFNTKTGAFEPTKFDKSKGVYVPSDAKTWSACAVLMKAEMTGWRSAQAPAQAVDSHTYFVVYEQRTAGKFFSTDVVYHPTYLYDGELEEQSEKEMTINGYRAALPADASLDVHLVSHEWAKANDVRNEPGKSDDKLEEQKYTFETTFLNTDIVYGPWKNIFYSCYFVLTGVHGLHVLGGMIPLSILLIQALRGKLFPNHTEYVGLYWHFVDLVWIYLFPLLYLI